MKMVLPQDFSVEDRKRMAADLFRKGYNCCQSVLLTFADVLELNKLATAKVLSVIGSGFGGGMARMREVCGSFSAAVCLSGFISPADNPDVKDARKNNYALVQELAETFKERNGNETSSSQTQTLQTPRLLHLEHGQVPQRETPLSGRSAG